jgi:hypothetical protein
MMPRITYTTNGSQRVMNLSESEVHHPAPSNYLPDFAIPPCPEHAPRPPLLSVPSVHFTCFVAAALSAAFATFLSALASALSAFTSALAAVFNAFDAVDVALASTPPCPEHAPFPAVVDVEPSLQTEVFVACADADVAMAALNNSAIHADESDAINRVRTRSPGTM